MRANSRVGTYAYANATVARHAPSSVTPAGQAAQALVYDLNGNMLTGLDGKQMTYDGENRPLSVTFGTKRTCYVYGADGVRLKNIEGTSTQACTDPITTQKVTLYMGPVEVRGYGTGNAEEILLYPHSSVRISKTKDAGAPDIAHNNGAIHQTPENGVTSWLGR